MKLKRSLAFIAVIGLSIAVVGAMLKFKTPVTRKAQSNAPVTVDVYDLAPAAWAPSTTTTGKVTPDEELHLTPLVSGPIIWVSPQAVPGGRFNARDTIARIDPQIYEIAVRQEESRVRNAELALEQEQARQGIAAREWELSGGDAAATSNPLALRKSHLDAAEHALRAAKSGLKKAQLELERTRIRAPFDAVINNETLSIGQLVGPSKSVAHLIGTQSFRVTAAVPLASLQWIKTQDADYPSTVVVSYIAGQGKEIRHQGKVLKVLPSLNPQTRRAQVLVSISDPLNSSKAIPLLPGSFVTLHFQGKPKPEVLKLPRAGVHEGNKIWLVTEEETLIESTVVPLWQTEDAIFVNEGVLPNTKLLITPLSLPVPGMKVKIRNLVTEGSSSLKTAQQSGTVPHGETSPQ